MRCNLIIYYINMNAQTQTQTQQQTLCKKTYIEYDDMLENIYFYDECDICYTDQHYIFTLYKRIHNCNIKICMYCLKKIMITSIKNFEYVMFLYFHNMNINNDLFARCPICRINYYLVDFFTMFREIQTLNKYFLKNDNDYYYCDL